MPQQHYHLHLKGFVGGYDFDSNYVDYVLSKHPDEQVHVLIDSLGGSLASALSIAAAFKQHGQVHVHFVGMNASAATIASLGAQHISIDQHAMYLVHQCSAEFFQWGSLNAEELADVVAHCTQAIADLEKMDENIASMYAQKCSKSHTDLLNLMRIGGWLTAQEAQQWGFIDEITDHHEPSPQLTEAMVTALAAEGIPIPNIPLQEKNTAFSKFLNALTNLFKSTPNNLSTNDNSHPNNTTAMTIHLQLLGALLHQEGFISEDGQVTLSNQQMQDIENALAQAQKDALAKDDTIAALQRQLQALQAAPADNTTNVVDDNKDAHTDPENIVQSFVNAFNNANQLFKDLP